MSNQYLDDIVQKIKTECDIGGFVELSVAIQDATKKARALSRALNRAVTPEQRIRIEQLSAAKRRYSYLLERERNAVSENRLELQRLNNEKAREAQQNRLAYQETARYLSQQRLEATLSRERITRMRKEIAEQRKLNRERRGMGIGGRIGTYLGAYLGIHTLQNMMNTGSRLQLVRKSIEGLTKSSQDWGFIQQQSFGTGTDIETVAKGYRNFFSSARMAGFDKEGIQSMYADMLLSTRAIGASTQQTEGALLALEQMLSKGTVSMEELRRQLGNALPGAFEIGAKAMNMTTAEFNKFVRTGQLASSVFVPKFISELKREYSGGFGEITQTLSFATTNLSNAWKNLQEEIFSGDTGRELAKAINELTKMLRSREFKQFIGYLGTIFKWLTQIFSYLMQNWRFVMMLLGSAGVIGLVTKLSGATKLLTVDIAVAIRYFRIFGLTGVTAFGSMSAAATTFYSVLFKILLPLATIEDLVMGIGQAFLGWNVRSVTGDAILAAKNKPTRQARNLNAPSVVNLPDFIKNNPKLLGAYQNAVKNNNMDEVMSIARYGVRPSYMSSSGGFNKTDVLTAATNMTFGDIKFEINDTSGNPVAIGNQINQQFFNLILSILNGRMPTTH